MKPCESFTAYFTGANDENPQWRRGLILQCSQSQIFKVIASRSVSAARPPEPSVHHRSPRARLGRDMRNRALPASSAGRMAVFQRAFVFICTVIYCNFSPLQRGDAYKVSSPFLFPTESKGEINRFRFQWDPASSRHSNNDGPQPMKRGYPLTKTAATPMSEVTLPPKASQVRSTRVCRASALRIRVGVGVAFGGPETSPDGDDPRLSSLDRKESAGPGRGEVGRLPHSRPHPRARRPGRTEEGINNSGGCICSGPPACRALPPWLRSTSGVIVFLSAGSLRTAVPSSPSAAGRPPRVPSAASHTSPARDNIGSDMRGEINHRPCQQHL
ncbi:hypothetical protein SKAU_G00317650 [Synaphobranchus kaupii]|uniref:Uncharacterized protein n=1 Tax=Synaphobranchus kaupii TaxID=118154 RepID=A0A9Q1ESX1_SYNKA|nr:hypothetical protein SKAU_G00317650 [Synaphobranchus kaupii]